MKKEIEEYSKAVQRNIEATRNETMAKEEKRKAYHELMVAKENLRVMERDLIDNWSIT